jgi:hypothetical protein
VNICLSTIPHKKQRYPTVGDWIVARGRLRHIFISDMDNEDYAFLVGIHELIEAWLCLKRGISQKDVDKFDMDFEQNRDFGDESEPGDSRKAPYFVEHQFATMVERMLATELGIDWDLYDHTVGAL